jgi:hypothetical protein
MKQKLLVALFVLASSLAFPQSVVTDANSKSNDEQAVRQVLTDLYTALGHNDAATLDRIWAKDYTFGDESGGLTMDARPWRRAAPGPKSNLKGKTLAVNSESPGLL